MVEGESRAPLISVSGQNPDASDLVAIGSLAVLALGCVGWLFSLHGFAVTFLILWALFGFGSSALLALGYRGSNLVTLSAPLGLGILLVGGAFMSISGQLLRVGPSLFWILTGLSVVAHVATLRRSGRFGPGGTRHDVVAPRWTAKRWNDSRRIAPLRDATRQRSRYMVGTLIALGLILCITSALAIRNLNPGWGGLLQAISPLWYVGLLLLVGAILVGQRGGGLLAGLPVIALQLCLTATPALVYQGPRYAWTIKQVGSTEYILLHGSANATINIYQAWPGLFSATAWLSRVASFNHPMTIAAWWPVVIDAATLLAVYRLALRILGDSERAWLAGAVFVMSYTISDADYFSSQSTGYLLAIAIFAVVYRHRRENAPMTNPEWLLLLVLAMGEAVTHQLTPYMATAATAILVVFGRSRTRWAPVITLGPAVSWALAHYAYVKQNVSFGQLFNIFSNFATPGAASGSPSPGQLANMFRLFQGASALFLGLVAVAAFLQYRSNLHVFLAVCSASGSALLFANSYGNEADFRVVLFALPWLSIMAATFEPSVRILSSLLWSVVLMCMLPLYLVADMGLDFVYAPRLGDFAVETLFEVTAPVGSSLVTIGAPENDPADISYRFDLVNEYAYANVLGFSAAAHSSPRLAYREFMTRLPALLQTNYQRIVAPGSRIYVDFTQQEGAYLAAYNYATLRQYQEFRQQFIDSPQWRSVATTSTAQLFVLSSKA